METETLSLQLDKSGLSAETNSNLENKDPSFCVVLPMFNEEANVEKCISTIATFLKKVPLKTGILVINDGSRDATGSKLDEMKALFPELIVETHPQNRGYGAANMTGIRRASQETFDYVLFMDGDLTQRVDFIFGFIKEMRRGTDFIKATRYAKDGGVDGVPFKRWLVSLVGNFLARQLFRLPLTDYTNGFRAAKTSIISKIKCEETGFSYLIEEVYRVAPFCKTFAEVPYTLTVRPENISGSKFSYSFKTYYSYLKYLFRR